MGNIEIRARNGTGSTSAVDLWAQNSVKTLITTPVKFGYSSANAADAYFVSKGTVTDTLASPAVFTLSTHTLVTGAQVKFTTTGALYTGLTAGQTYFAIKIDANSFWVAPTYADAMAGTNKIGTSGTESGTHTLYIPGTGANTVRVWLLDSSGNVQIEDVLLNGQTKVDSSITLAYRILKMEVVLASSGGVSAGIIYAYDNTDTVTSGVPQTAAKIQGVIAAGSTEDMQGHYTIPKGFTGTIKGFLASFPDITTTAKYGYVDIQYKPYLGTLWKVFHRVGLESAGTGAFGYVEGVPETIPALSDIRVQYRQSAACEAYVHIDLEISPV